MTSDIRQLAFDTLFNKMFAGMESAESCFFVNKAGQKLRACSVEALPVLEEIIREKVAPAMDEYRVRNGVPNWEALLREGPPFAGLSEFLGAYWIICARTDPRRAIEFMKKMSRPVVSESVSRLPLFFNPAISLSDVPLPTEYVDYLIQLIKSDVEEFKTVGRFVIEKLGVDSTSADAS